MLLVVIDWLLSNDRAYRSIIAEVCCSEVLCDEKHQVGPVRLLFYQAAIDGNSQQLSIGKIRHHINWPQICLLSLIASRHNEAVPLLLCHEMHLNGQHGSSAIGARYTLWNNKLEECPDITAALSGLLGYLLHATFYSCQNADRFAGCAKRKVRCDKHIPCSRCLRLGIACSREPVRLTRTLQHEEQINFLGELVKELEAVPGDPTGQVIQKLEARIQRLQSGDDDLEDGGFDDCLTPKQNDTAVVREELPGDVNATATEADPSLLTSLEHLAWGRVSGNCFPHKNCRCEHRHRHSTFSNPAVVDKFPSLPDPDTARKLVEFHLHYLSWHHNCLHGPTFQSQCAQFWQTGQCRDPLWVALYCSVLSATVFAIQNSEKSRSIVQIGDQLPQAHELFSDMITALYRFHFLSNLSIHSVQAITISTEVAHNLGQSQLNATLFNAAVRIAECLGLHRIEDSSVDDWEAKVERETGKRVWCQMTIQDHFAIPFTESYTISPTHVSTSIPSNTDDHNLLSQPESVPTVSSYTRVLSKLASLMPEMRDGLGPAKDQKPLQEQYMHILSIDRRMRETVKSFPPYFLRQNPDQEALIPWLAVARRSLAITSAEKIIMIHRPFLFRSFQMPLFDFTRRTCTAAAVTILREHEALIEADDLSIWTHTAFCITAAVILCFEVYQASDNEAAENHKLKVRGTRDRLVSRESDLLAQRGVALIDTLLDQRSADSDATGTMVVDFDYIAAALYPVVASHNVQGTPSGNQVASNASMFDDPQLSLDLMESGFDSWFSDMFVNDGGYTA